MKKLLSVVVVFVMLVAMSVSVFADTVAPTTTYDAEEGNWTTSGTDAAYAGSMMTMVAISGDAISVNSIQYIDQTRANETGAYSFAGYLPKEDPAQGVTYQVYVGGQKIANPIEAGTIYYVAPAVNEVTITGTVIKTGITRPATIALLDANGENAVTPVTADPETGDFSITAPAGIYTLQITKPGHTKYMNTVDISTLTPGAEYTIYAGNANGDKFVGVFDITTVVGFLDEDPATLGYENYDVNDDGNIGVFDITTIVGFLDKEDTILPVPEA